MLMDSLVSIYFPRVVCSSSIEKFTFFIILSDALTMFVISFSSSVLCIAHLPSRLLLIQGFLLHFFKPSMFIKKQGFIQVCYLFWNFKCLFCFWLNIILLNNGYFSATISTRPVRWDFLDFRKGIWSLYLFLVTTFTGSKNNSLVVGALLPKLSTIFSNSLFQLF